MQVLLGERVYQSHELTYGGELITCHHCGAPVTGESIVKKQTGKVYVYYRCSRYRRVEGHPQVRLTEAALDAQVLSIFVCMKQPEAARDWFSQMLRRWVLDEQQERRAQADGLQRELSSLRRQKDQLLTLRLNEEIEADTFAQKNTELRDRVATTTLQIEAADRSSDEHAQMAQKVFELSQSLEERWLTADYAAKRQILEMICSNFRLDGVTLVPEMRKPFDVLVKGLSVPSSRGDRI